MSFVFFIFLNMLKFQKIRVSFFNNSYVGVFNRYKA